MTPAGELLAAEIRRDGPVPFRALHGGGALPSRARLLPPPRDPFGKHGDFFTAEQIQPVFGILMAARIRQLYRAMGEPAGLHRGGAGRRPARDGRGVLRVALRSRRSRFRRAAGTNSAAWSSPTNSSTRCRWTSPSYRDGAFREQRVALRRRPLRLGDRRRRLRRGSTTTSAAISRRRRKAAGTKPTSTPLALDGPHRPRARLRLRAHHRLRLHARRGRPLSRRDADGLPPAHARAKTCWKIPASATSPRTSTSPRCEEPARARGLRDRALRDAGADAAGRRRARPVRRRARLRRADELRRRMQLKTLLFGMGETFRVLLQRAR